LGHILFGDFQLSLTTSLLLGSVPGVYIGARVSAVAPGRVIRRALAFVLAACVVVGPLFWHFVRSTGGLRRGWPPAEQPAEDHGPTAAGTPSIPGADVISIGAARAADQRPDADPEPVQLAGRRP